TDISHGMIAGQLTRCPLRLVSPGIPNPHRQVCSQWVIPVGAPLRSEEHTSELQSPCNLVCRLLLEKKKKFVSIARDKNVDDLTPDDVDVTAIRGFLADLHRPHISASSAVRKLSALRTFIKYLTREA